jgi:hypothetical protein
MNIREYLYIQGVNIPLQQRGIKLDLDNSRVNTPVIDYDTMNEKSVRMFSMNDINSDYQQNLVS